MSMNPRSSAAGPHLSAVAVLLLGITLASAQALPSSLDRPLPPGQQHPDLSGTWEWDQGMSRLQIPAPESMQLVIEHKEPALVMTRRFLFGGQENTIHLDLFTDGREIRTKDADQATVSHLHWEGKILVFEAEITLKDGRKGTNIVRYELSADGNTLIALEKFAGPKLRYENSWVMHRAKP